MTDTINSQVDRGRRSYNTTKSPSELPADEGGGGVLGGFDVVLLVTSSPVQYLA